MKNIDKLLTSNNAFTAEEANAIGISNERLRLLIKQKKIERVDYGVYIPSGAYHDQMYSFQKRRNFIYSHETALFLHELTDRDPLNYVCTVKKGYNSRKLKEAGFEIFYIKGEHYPVDVISMETVFGNAVKTYSMERTLCDIMRSETRIDKEIIVDAFKKYCKRKDKDLQHLMNIADMFRVKRKVSVYLEILL